MQGEGGCARRTGAETADARGSAKDVDARWRGVGNDGEPRTCGDNGTKQASEQQVPRQDIDDDDDILLTRAQAPPSPSLIHPRINTKVLAPPSTTASDMARVWEMLRNMSHRMSAVEQRQKQVLSEDYRRLVDVVVSEKRVT